MYLMLDKQGDNWIWEWRSIVIILERTLLILIVSYNRQITDVNSTTILTGTGWRFWMTNPFLIKYWSRKWWIKRQRNGLKFKSRLTRNVYLTPTCILSTSFENFKYHAIIDCMYHYTQCFVFSWFNVKLKYNCYCFFERLSDIFYYLTSVSLHSSQLSSL